MWIKFANLCRKSDRMVLAEKTINSLLSSDRVGASFALALVSSDNEKPYRDQMKAPNAVVYAQLKYIWATGAREESLNYLRTFCANLERGLQNGVSAQLPDPVRHKPDQKLDEISRLLARCYLKLGEWQVALRDDWGSVSVSAIGMFAAFDTMILLCSGTSRISYIPTTWLLITIRHGIRHNIRGHSRISMLSVTWKPRRRTKQRMPCLKIWRCISHRRSMVRRRRALFSRPFTFAPRIVQVHQPPE